MKHYEKCSTKRQNIPTTITNAAAAVVVVIKLYFYNNEIPNYYLYCCLRNCFVFLLLFFALTLNSYWYWKAILPGIAEWKREKEHNWRPKCKYRKCFLMYDSDYMTGEPPFQAIFEKALLLYLIEQYCQRTFNLRLFQKSKMFCS